MSNVVHVAGEADNGIQLCSRCGWTITEPGLTPFEALVLVRRIEAGGCKATTTVKSATTAEMCVPGRFKQ